jgi:hypothetical protein
MPLMPVLGSYIHSQYANFMSSQNDFIDATAVFKNGIFRVFCVKSRPGIIYLMTTSDE